MNIDFILVNVLKYLEVKDLMKLMSVSKAFFKLITSHSTEIFDYFDLTYSSEDLPRNSKFITDVISKNDIKKINLTLCENLNLINLILKAVKEKNGVKTLGLPLSIFESKTVLKKFSNVTSLAVKNMYFNECGLENNLYLIGNLIPMTKLTKLKLNNIKFTSAEFINLLQCKLEYIDLRECMEFKIEDFSNYLLQNSNSIRTLKLDGENSSLFQLIHLIPNMNALRELTISYCENLDDNFLIMISLISEQFTKLTLRKLRNISRTGFISFFQNANLLNLEKLDMNDAPRLSNDAVREIAKNSRLKYLDISWSEMVKNDSIISILENCRKLEKLFLQGCKCLDELALSILLDEENIKRGKFKNIKLIDLTKCDLIPDQIISSIYDKYPTLTIINYYGRDLRSDFYFLLTFKYFNNFKGIDGVFSKYILY